MLAQSGEAGTHRGIGRFIEVYGFFISFGNCDMKTRASLRYLGNLLAITLMAGVGVSTPAYGDFQQFFTLPGATLDGQPVSARVDFTTSAGLITVTLVNLQANPTSVVQAISDISFSAGGLTSTGAGSFLAQASYISIANGVSTPAADPQLSWQLTNSGGIYHLNKLWGGSGPQTGPKGLVIGPGPYTNANGSISNNKPHNPFADQSVTFSLALAGITAATVISDVVFSFGTTPGANVGVLVPIPAAVWLFITGLLGLVAIGRRRVSLTPVAG
jgi:hypothetical protein